MNTDSSTLRVWSIDAENEAAFRNYVNVLFECARACASEPEEEAAKKACGASRNVWDTAEGMLHSNLLIQPNLLAQAIEGIGECIKSVSEMNMPTDTPAAITEHLREMVHSMTERRDDLVVLLEKGKMGFMHRLREHRLAGA